LEPFVSEWIAPASKMLIPGVGDSLTHRHVRRGLQATRSLYAPESIALPAHQLG
jgi:hypothetical protein